MDHESIEEVRKASFSIARRGYEKEEVDRYLRALADRLEQDGPARSGSQAVKRELELVSEKTASILAQAEESAERLHTEAVREASSVLGAARQEAEATREAADQYAAQVRAEAEGEVHEAAEAAAAEARHAAAESDQQRTELETEVSELVRRRDELLADLDRLAEEIRDTVASRRGAATEEPARSAHSDNGPGAVAPVPDGESASLEHSGA